MLYDSKVNALALRKQCFWHPKSNAFQARKLCFRKVEEEWKRTFSLPPPESPLYKGFSEEKVEVEEKTLKIFMDEPKRTHGSFSVTLRNRSECGLFHGTKGEVMVSDGFADGVAGEGDGLLQHDVG